ncbi:MAG: hypothetical protein FJ299_02460 [Planctomycetes bacterium]|nr:hypothetical protein [Planctomycetota bacterium]
MDGHPDCLLIQSQLQLHAGGDLTREEGELVERHLARCTECAELAARARRSRQRLAEAAYPASSVATSASLWPRIAAGLQPVAPTAERAADPVPAPARGKLLHFPRLAKISGLAAALLCAGWWLAQRGTPAELPNAAADENVALVDAPTPQAGIESSAPDGTAVADLGSSEPAAAARGGGLRRMSADELPFSDFAQDPAALRVLPVRLGAAPSGATPASVRELR